MSTNRLESLLTDLGAARAAGVIPASNRTAPGRFPWETAPASAARGLKWARLAVPMAAAAMLAIVFVGPSLRHRSSMPPVAVHDAGMIATTVANHDAVNADCNGDGRVNGDDIQCYISQQAAPSGSAGLQPEELTRRLLGT